MQASAAAERGLLDTSVFIAGESGRALGTLPALQPLTVTSATATEAPKSALSPETG